MTRTRMADSISERNHIEKMLSHFGRAVFQCHVFERRLAMLLATVHGPSPHESTSEAFNTRFDQYCKLPLGRLIEKYRDFGEVPAEIEANLDEMCELRNWLAHRYFWDRAEGVYDRDAREAMIAELLDAERFIFDFENVLAAEMQRWRAKHGVDEVVDEMVRKQVDQIMSRRS